MRRLTRLTRLMLAFCFAAATMAATVAAQTQDDDERVRVDTRLVTVNVSVTDSCGKPVKGLTQKHF